MPRHYILCVILAIACLGMRTARTGNLNIHIQHCVGKLPLKLDSASYKNSLQQDFRVSKFRYYIGELRLVSVDSKLTAPSEYFLVDEDFQNSKNIQLQKIAPGNYSGLEFIIGVDSLHNCSGAQSGALDPVHGMFWAWNTGYIFLKLEGTAAQSTAPLRMFEYHIGGYRQPNNCIRKIKLKFPEVLTVTLSKNNRIDLSADVLGVLEGQTQIDFSKLSSVTDHRNAETLADNYAKMFSVK